MKDNTFVVKKQYQFPQGVSESTKQAVTEHWKRTRGVDLTKPQFELYSVKQQKKEQQQKSNLDKRTIKSKNDDEYFATCSKLRKQGYGDSTSTGNWKMILQKEKQLKEMGFKTKVSFYKGWYTLWRR